MRALCCFLLLLLSLPAIADTHAELYEKAGWPQQRAHFSDALSAAQARYSKSPVSYTHLTLPTKRIV